MFFHTKTWFSIESSMQQPPIYKRLKCANVRENHGNSPYIVEIHEITIQQGMTRWPQDKITATRWKKCFRVIKKLEILAMQKQNFYSNRDILALLQHEENWKFWQSRFEECNKNAEKERMLNECETKKARKVDNDVWQWPLKWYMIQTEKFAWKLFEQFGYS